MLIRHKHISLKEMSNLTLFCAIKENVNDRKNINIGIF